MKKLSAVLAVRDEEEMIDGAIRSVKFADEIIVLVDSRTTDNTKKIALGYTDKVFEQTFTNFSEFKNFAISKSTADWILIIDADERVSRALKEEVLRVIKANSHTAYKAPFQNYFYGSIIKHGHWDKENNIRLFRNNQQIYYKGDIHEALDIPGSAAVGQLVNPICHFTHRSVIDNLYKTANYASLQSSEMKSTEREVTSRKLFSVMIKEFYFRMISGRAYKDGVPGIIDAVYQAFSVFCIYAHLWELQQKPSIKEKYCMIEEGIDD